MARIAIYVGLLAFVGSFVLSAQNAAPPGVPGTVEGRVANALTGEPIGGASVHLFPFVRRGGASAQAQTAASQPDGIFHFDSVPQGAYFLIAGADGYVTTGGRGQNGRLVVDSGQQITGVVVQLSPLGSISGKVLDENGQPVPGASVAAYTTYVMRGKLQLRRGRSTTAGKAGEYILKKLSPGNYYLSAESAKGSHDTRSPNDEAAPVSEGSYVRTFYPSVLDVQSATLLEVAAGQQSADIDIRMKRAIVYQVRGRVAQDAAIGRPSLLLSPRDTLDANVFGTSTHPAKDGTFEFKDVLPGSYTLWLIGTFSSGQSSPRRYGGFKLLARQDLDVSASDVNGIVLSLTPPINLTGRITAEGIDKQMLAQLRVAFMPSGQVMMGNFQSAAVDGDGNFEAPNLSPGTYSIRVNSPPAGAYVKEITYNRQDITANGLDVSLGGGGEIEIVIRTGAGEVDGTIAVSSSGLANPVAFVILVPDNVASDGSGTLTAPVSGNSFAVRSVPPGHYYAYAVGASDSIWQNADFLREMQRDGTSVDVQENARVEVELPVIDPDAVEVTAARLGLSAQ